MLSRGKSRYKVHAVAIAAIAFVAFSLYLNALGNEFVYDDIYVVLDNSLIRDTEALRDIFLSDEWSFKGNIVSGYYRPMLHVAFSAVYRIYGLDPFGYHLLNVVFHVLNAVLVYLSALTVFRQTGFAGVRAAFMASVLFAAHPIQTEPVSWVSSFSDLSYAFFFLVSFLLYARYGSRTLGLALSVLFFALSLLSKEAALVLPVFLLAYDFSSKGLSAEKKGLIAGYSPYVLVVSIYMWVRIYAIGGFAPVVKTWDLSAPESFMNIFPLFSSYIYKLVLPLDFNAFHVFTPLGSIPEPSFMASLPVFFIYMLSLWLTASRARGLFFLLLWVLIPLVPVFYIPALGSNVFAERYLYLSTAGFAMLLAAAMEKVDVLMPRWHPALTLFLAVTLLYSAATLARGHVWRDDLTLWRDTAGKSPHSPIPRNNLGVAYEKRGLYEEAVNEYLEALKIRPGFAMAHNNLGIVYRKQGRYEDALNESATALALKPDYAEAHNNLGIIHNVLGRYGDAEKEYRAALKINPDYAEAHNNLGITYQHLKRYDEAMEEFADAITLRHDYAEAYFNLGRLYLETGSHLDAVRQFSSAVELKPGFVEARFYLAASHIRAGRIENATVELEKVLQLDPGHEDAREILKYIKNTPQQ